MVGVRFKLLTRECSSVYCPVDVFVQLRYAAYGRLEGCLGFAADRVEASGSFTEQLKFHERGRETRTGGGCEWLAYDRERQVASVSCVANACGE